MMYILEALKKGPDLDVQGWGRLLGEGDIKAET